MLVVGYVTAEVTGGLLETVRNFVSGCEINSENSDFSQADTKNITIPLLQHSLFHVRTLVP
jgi:hypothetical protein